MSETWEHYKGREITIRTTSNKQIFKNTLINVRAALVRIDGQAIPGVAGENTLDILASVKRLIDLKRI